MDTKETKMVKLIWNQNDQFSTEPSKIMPWILNQMSNPKKMHSLMKVHQIGRPIAMGYFGSTISLFIILMRDLREERNFARHYFNKPIHFQPYDKYVGIHSSTVHWRKTAEEDLRKRLHNLMIKTRTSSD